MEGEGVPVRRVQVGADLEGYSKLRNREQRRAQALFQHVLQAAAADAGLDRGEWITQSSGDGEIAILPAEVDETRVAGRFVPAVDGLLRRHDERRPARERLRLRMAVHQGLVHLDGASGFPGEAVVHLARLLDAPVLKQALAAYAGASVALAVSPEIYRDLCSYPGGLRPEWFREETVSVPAKGFTAQAWISVLGEDVNERARLSAEATPDVLATGEKDGRYVTGDVDNTGQWVQGDHGMAIGTIQGWPR
ncbi:hypothetical protein [Catenuloplanes indicus]|uniref:Class 3 adenylate cyclase n=1 Tax=Catenuloplanes indicus TaxID=137267 RepID=A0AAE3W642_9ACTN|nr:hypothetical protein [Catenuloplanes indicus]MDQ0370196.1 class 3 adenylate cyclase [Catenuloplanes indicus]